MHHAKAKWRLKSNSELSPERLAGHQILPQEIRIDFQSQSWPRGNGQQPLPHFRRLLRGHALDVVIRPPKLTLRKIEMLNRGTEVRVGIR